MVLLTSAFAGPFSAEKVYDEGSPGVESGQEEVFCLDWRSAGGRAETVKDNVDGGTGIGTEDEHFFVEAVRQPFSGKRNEAWRCHRRRGGAG